MKAEKVAFFLFDVDTHIWDGSTSHDGPTF